MSRVFALIVVCSAPCAHAYWAKIHEQINARVLKDGKPWGAGFQRGKPGIPSVLHPYDYLERVLYVSDPQNATLEGVPFQFNPALRGRDAPGDGRLPMPLPMWLTEGGAWEDGFVDRSEALFWGGVRAVNHFHDPLAPSGGYSALPVPGLAASQPILGLLRQGISATRWALNNSSGGMANRWGWPTIGNQFDELSNQGSRPDLREAAFAATMRSVGQLQHLISDASVPDHARDLPHPGDGFEEFVGKNHPTEFTDFQGTWLHYPLTYVQQYGVKAFWDRNLYVSSGATGTASTIDPAGMSEFSNANLFAWNKWDDAFKVPGWTVYFSTIPDKDFAPFDTTRAVATNLLRTRTRSTTYPWPQLASITSHHWSSAPGTLPLSPIAADDSFFGANALDDDSWANYLDPVVERVLGYSESVMSLAFQPARAELRTAQNGDILTLSVRLWNLWPVGGRDSLTWKIDEVFVSGVRPDHPLPPENRPVHVPWTATLAPGQQVTSPEVTISWEDRANLSRSSYAMVNVHAHLDNAEKTLLHFTIPIPGSLPLVQQTGGYDLSPPFPLGTGNCNTAGACLFQGEVSVFRNPREQRVTGTIKLMPPEFDILDRPASTNLKKFLKEDARVAEVMLFGFPHSSSRQDFKPNFGGSATVLAITNANFRQVTPTLWARKPDAPDQDDGDINFEAAISLDEFVVPDIASPLEDANRAAGSIYLAVFTASGGMYLQRLILWPLRNIKTADAATVPPVCDLGVPRSSVLNEDRAICKESDVPPCKYQLQRVQALWADPGWATTEGGTPVLRGQILSMSDDVRPKSLSNMPVALDGPALRPKPCNAAEFNTIFPNGNGKLVCGYLSPNGLQFVAAENSPLPVSGTCPALSPLANPRTATYHRYFLPGSLDVLKAQLGIQQLPPEWEFNLQ